MSLSQALNQFAQNLGRYRVQSFDEPLDGDAGEVAPVEELLLETPEEPLRGRVVRGAALRAHGSGQLVLPADADPSGPPVMAAAVTVKPMSV